MTNNTSSTNHRADLPDLPDPRPMVAVTEHTLAALTEVLSLTEEFLRTAGPGVHAELRGYLRAQWPPADPAWLIDMLGFHSLHLRHQLPTPAPSPRENWQPADHPADQPADHPGNPGISEEVAW